MVEKEARLHDLDIIRALARVDIKSFGSCFCYGVVGIVVVTELVDLILGA